MIELSEFIFNVRRKVLQGFEWVSVSGRNSDVDQSEEIIYDGTWAGFPTTASTVDVVSTSANDDLTGTGAQKIRLKGYKAGYVRDEEVINMDGTTPVTSANSWLWLYDQEVIQCGSNGTNAGAISGSISGSQVVRISTGNGKGQLAAYAVPAGFMGYLYYTKIQYRNTSDPDATINARVRITDTVNNVAKNNDIFAASLDGHAVMEKHHNYMQIPEKNIVSLHATGASNQNDVYGNIEMLILPSANG